MKFLTKRSNSEIFTEKHVYREGGDNSTLRGLLVLEQKNFCAYSEKYIVGLDSVEVEHFNPAKKGNDDYFNYYAALRDCNAHNKKEYPHYKHSAFFSNLFFQDSRQFNARIEYKEGQYQEIDEFDTDALELIAFLGFNRITLYNQRKNHVKRLKKTFEDAAYTNEQKMEHFRNNKQDLDFITALEIELKLDLSEFYN